MILSHCSPICGGNVLDDVPDRSLVDLPSRHLLRAALLAARALTSVEGTPLVQLPGSWIRTPSDGTFSPEELHTGFMLLVQARFLFVVGPVVIPAGELTTLLGQSEGESCQVLLERLIEIRRPLWVLGVTAGGEIADELIPDTASVALRQVFPDPYEREMFLLALGERFTDADAKRIGQLAELAAADACRKELLEAGREDLAALVRRVSLTSDQLGYDVTAPRLDFSSRRLEVKGTRSSGQHFLVVITRNEARVASLDPNWFLVVCRVHPDDSASVLGWTTNTLLAPRLPVDKVQRGGWRSAAVPLEETELTRGLPPCQGLS
jgi:Protein NO VEIN, C-terminal